MSSLWGTVKPMGTVMKLFLSIKDNNNGEINAHREESPILNYKF